MTTEITEKMVFPVNKPFQAYQTDRRWPFER